MTTDFEIAQTLYPQELKKTVDKKPEFQNAKVIAVNSDGTLKVKFEGYDEALNVGKYVNAGIGDTVSVAKQGATNWMAVAVAGGESLANMRTAGIPDNSWLFRTTGGVSGSVRDNPGFPGWNTEGKPTQFPVPLTIINGGVGSASLKSSTTLYLFANSAALNGSGWEAIATPTSGIGAVVVDSTGNLYQVAPLPVSTGGTGLTASPSMLTNLATTAAANVMQASPRPGVTGILPVANGGTGTNIAQTHIVNLDNVQGSLVAGQNQINVRHILPIANGGSGNDAMVSATDTSILSAIGSSVSISSVACDSWGAGATVYIYGTFTAAWNGKTNIAGFTVNTAWRPKRAGYFIGLSGDDFIGISINASGVAQFVSSTAAKVSGDTWAVTMSYMHTPIPTSSGIQQN